MALNINVLVDFISFLSYFLIIKLFFDLFIVIISGAECDQERKSAEKGGLFKYSRAKIG